MVSSKYPTDWRSRGACLTADPELFFPISSVGPAQRQISQAKAVCGRCEVQQQCLSFALETGQVYGIWGGTSAEERQLMRRRPRNGQPVRRQPVRRQPSAA